MGCSSVPPPIPLPVRREPHPSAGLGDWLKSATPGAALAPGAPRRATRIMGSQSSKAPRDDVTAEEAAGASPAKAKGQENGHVKSNGDLSPKGEGESPPMNGTEEAAGTTADTMEPAPPSQAAEVKGGAPAKKTPKKKKFSFKKPFKLSGLSFKRNRKEGGGDSSASSPTEEEQEQGEIGACGEEGTAQEGKAVATPESQEPQANGAEASAASKGGNTEEEAGPQAAEPPYTPSGPESGPTPASEQNE